MGGKNSKNKKEKTAEAAPAPANDAAMTEQDKIFKEFDTDKSGYLEVGEVKQALDKLSGNFNITPTDDEVKVIISEIDTDGDNKLNMAEFNKLYDQILTSGNEIKEQFNFFDKNGDGSVSKAELKKALKDLNEKMSKSDLKRMIKDADVDGDGEISFEEFQKMLVGT